MMRKLKNTEKSSFKVACPHCGQTVQRSKFKKDQFEIICPICKGMGKVTVNDSGIIISPTKMKGANDCGTS